MYCRDCDEWVEAVFVDGQGWRGKDCGHGPVYESKAEMVDADHFVAWFQKEHGYGPWWEGDDAS